MTPFGITVSGKKEKVLSHLGEHRTKQEGAAVELIDVLDRYVQGLPDSAQISLSFSVMCNYSVSPAGPREVGY